MLEKAYSLKLTTFYINLQIQRFKSNGKGYLTCCCLEPNIYNRCLYSLRDRCFVTPSSTDRFLDLMFRYVTIYYHKILNALILVEYIYAHILSAQPAN